MKRPTTVMEKTTRSRMVNRRLTDKILRLFNRNQGQEWTMKDLSKEIGRSIRDVETRRTVQQLMRRGEIEMTLDGKLKKFDPNTENILTRR